MNLLEKDLKLLLDTLADRCTTETMRSVMDTMKQSMDDGEIPPTETVRSFIQHPEQPTDLTAFQQALAHALRSAPLPLLETGWSGQLRRRVSGAVPVRR